MNYMMQDNLQSAAQMRQYEMRAEARQVQLLHSRAGAEQYRVAYRRGRMRQFWARLIGRSNRLLAFCGAKPAAHAQRFGGIQTVPIQQICGSEGRSDDFDHDFNPLVDHTRQRWINIFDAYQRGESLPPVELIRVGDCYFVRDGHHRISVARTLGSDYVDAVVTAAG